MRELIRAGSSTGKAQPVRWPGHRNSYAAREVCDRTLACLRQEATGRWMTVDDSLFLGTWTDKQSSIPYHDVCDAGLDFVGFFSLRSDMSAIWL
ncbi:hypothetical protein TNCV_2959561 [Trichonephila clavipes]|nr:hypothetical protein TNCV_2959561 [Trichonephila clavipes]